MLIEKLKSKFENSNVFTKSLFFYGCLLSLMFVLSGAVTFCINNYGTAHTSDYINFVSLELVKAGVFLLCEGIIGGIFIDYYEKSRT